MTLTVGSATVRAGERGVDFSFARPPAVRLLELGYTFVVGYISVPPASPAKNVSKSECEAYIAAGLRVLLVWEMSATSAGQGAPVGTAHGRDAKRLASERGYPIDVPILVADDTNTVAANIAAHEAYVRAFAQACAPYPIGIYGDTDILARCAGLWRIGWVPNAWSWSGSSRKDAEGKAKALGAHVLQRTGFYIDNLWAVDPNDAIADFPAWGTVPVPAPVPTPTPPPPVEEDDMKSILYTVTDPAGAGAWFYVSPELNVRTLATVPEYSDWVAAGALERAATPAEFRDQLLTLQPVGSLTAPAQNVLGEKASADWVARATVTVNVPPVTIPALKMTGVIGP